MTESGYTTRARSVALRGVPFDGTGAAPVRERGEDRGQKSEVRGQKSEVRS